MHGHRSKASSHVECFPGAQYKFFPTQSAARDWLVAQPVYTAPSAPANLFRVSSSVSRPPPAPSRYFNGGGDGGGGRGDPSAVAPPRRSQEPSIALTPAQNEVLELILAGENVFFTGSAGTGKSLILEHVKYHLDQRGATYAVTAPTGIAAVLIAGQTIHSFAGVGYGEKGLRDYTGMMHGGAGSIGAKKKQWGLTDVLVIDEVSMVGCPLAVGGVVHAKAHTAEPRSLGEAERDRKVGAQRPEHLLW